MFSNAESVFINNKEVDSIILEDGGILYQKPDEYNLALSTTKSNLSAYDNDEATITATLTHGNSPVNNETIIFDVDTPIQTSIITTNGTYDFGNNFVIDLSNLPNGYSNSYLITIGDISDKYITMYRYLENSFQIEFNETNIYSKDNGIIYINNGVMSFYMNKEYIEIDVSDIDLTQWHMGSNAGPVIINKYFHITGTTNNNGQCTATYNSYGIGELDITVEASNLNLNNTITINDYYRYIESETTLLQNQEFLIYNNTPSNFKCSFDYYPTTSDEWLMIYFGSQLMSVLSSDGDKGNNFGLSDLEYNLWIPISIQFKDDVLIVKVEGTYHMARKEVSINAPFNLILKATASSSKIKNIKVGGI